MWEYRVCLSVRMCAVCSMLVCIAGLIHAVVTKSCLHFDYVCFSSCVHMCYVFFNACKLCFCYALLLVANILFVCLFLFFFIA